MKTRVLRIGVAGLGEAATEFLPGYHRHPLVRLSACADPRPAARERFTRDFGGRAYSDVADMCTADDLDVIVVATNHEYHRDPVIWAAQAGRHVVVEKPMALTLADCDEMIDACDRAGVRLLAGHSHSYDAPVRSLRRLIADDSYGPLSMIHGWNFNDFMTRPYPDGHLAQSRGVVLNQAPHHIDIVRYLGGGLLRSVRATVLNRSVPVRPGFGAYACFLRFANGVPVTLVYSGYGLFDSAELFGWYGEGGQPRQPATSAASRKNFLALDDEERTERLEALKERLRYGSVGLGERAAMPPGWEKGGRPPGAAALPTKQPFFGLLLVSCDRADIRQYPDGLAVYADGGRQDIPVTGMPDARQAEIDELYQAVVHDRPLIHDGRWAKATLEASLAILQSSEEDREIILQHQTALPEGT